MRAMILAAGRGERMREFTAQTPKPLLRVDGRYLIEYPLENLRRAGIREVVINVSYLGEQIQAALGDGSRFGIKIIYSVEPERLEVGGGIFQALPHLGAEPFIVVSGDVITDYPLANLPQQPVGLAHLVMIDNPTFHPKGDFGLREGYVDKDAKPTLTFANIGVYRPEVFAGCQPGHFRWSQVMMPAIQQGKVTGEHFRGTWYNVGSPEELAIANARAREDSNLRPLASETNTLSN